MLYKELREITFKDWDGKPFYAIVIDNDEKTLLSTDSRRYDAGEGVLVTGYDNESWWCETNRFHWKHAYPLEWNKKPKPKRMTNRQLAMWLAKGNGEKKCENARAVDSNHIYMNDEAGEPCPDYIKVRKWYTKEWIEPTVNLLEEW